MHPLIILVNIVLVLMLYELSKFVFEIPGDPDLDPLKKKGDDRPRTVGDLRSENLGLDKDIYDRFKTGVRHYLRDEHEKAFDEYNEVLKSAKPDIDLYEKSETFRINFDLVKKRLGLKK